MIPIAHARLIQIPSPRLAKKKLSGIEMIRTRTSTVAIEPIPIATRLSGTDAGIVDADLAEDDDEHGGEAEEEDDLADRARVPADDGDGRPVAARPCTSRSARRHASSSPKRNVRRPPIPARSPAKGNARDGSLGRSIARSI